MTKQNHPEQRSVTGAGVSPDQPAPQPTGDEVFEPSTVNTVGTRETDRVAAELSRRHAEQSAAGGAEEEAVRQLQESVETLQTLATEYFNRLSETASQLTQQAQQIYGVGRDQVREHPTSFVIGGFVLGVAIGLLSGGRD